MMNATGIIYYNNGLEFELIITDEGSYMYDGIDSFVKVVESCGDEYHEAGNVKRIFTLEKVE